uniref:C2H2-type domain-containing protein n=1 Tax=Kalanchoe fedtschenkoi TaxID=63787 RepID=A0A7N0TJE6_KALFE
MSTEEVISSSFIQTPIDGSTATISNPPASTIKKKRSLPGTPDPEAEVIALSPRTLMATNRFLCEICGKGFQRDQNLQLHRRGHNLPWKLKQRSSKEPKKRVYVCPEKTCVHHLPSRALGDLTGIKKHFCRKHGEKKWKCEKCSKRYAVQSDWKAHSKTCGTREYKCDCGTLFSRRDSFITHRAFCDALAEESARVSASNFSNNNGSAAISSNMCNNNYHFMGTNSMLQTTMGQHHQFNSIFKPMISSSNNENEESIIYPMRRSSGLSLWNMHQGSALMAQLGHHQVNNSILQDQTGLFNPIISSCHTSSPHPQSSVEYPFNWPFGGAKLSPTNNTSGNHEIKNSTMQPLKELNSTEPQHVVSVPSLYSNQHQIHQTSNTSTNMSATALLQKAAQIGATSTTDPSVSILSSFSLKPTPHSNNNICQLVQDGNKFCGFFSSPPSSGSVPASVTHIVGTNCSDMDHNDVSNSLNHNSQMYPSKRRHIAVQNNEDQNAAAGGGQTRDFLGVGAQTLCHPSTMNGWI